MFNKSKKTYEKTKEGIESWMAEEYKINKETKSDETQDAKECGLVKELSES